ncbi:MAG: NYN domain-containing protein [bacterium]
MSDKKERNYAFIDSQNLNLGVKSQGWSLDFHRFRVFLQNKYNIQKAYLFIGFVSGNQMLYSDLQEAGFICVFKPTLEIKENGRVKIKGNVDAELVLHSMIEYPNYKKAIIVSGDGDFYCLIEYLDKNNKLRKIIVPNARYSSLIRKYSKYIVNIQLFKKKLVKQKRGISAG